jgi:hypothetical protein
MPRDVLLARLLSEHRVLTTAQITALLFSNAGTARNRLRQLRELGFVDRFTHRSPAGNRVTCWVPGLLSARYSALVAGLPAPTPRAVRQLQDRILANPQLDHLLGVNQFFTDLAHHGCTHPGTRLLRWWSAEHTAAAFAGRIHPDGHGVWQSQPPPSEAGDVVGTTVGFWLEHDRGSEPLGRVLAKLGAYQRLQHAGGPTYPILFRLPNRQREANLQHLLAPHPAVGHLVVATSVHPDDDPADAVWRVAGTAAGGAPPREPLVRLADLPCRPSTIGPLNPAVDSDVLQFPDVARDPRT